MVHRHMLPTVDLKAPYERMRGGMDVAIAQVLESTAFRGAPVARA